MFWYRTIEFLGLAIYFQLNQIQEAAARHLGKFQMTIGLSLESGSSVVKYLNTSSI